MFNNDIYFCRLGTDKCEIIRISAPIKQFWAKELNLDYKELLSDGPYKEKYRKEMIIWSDKVRHNDYGFFCREAMKLATRDIIFVSDIRRKTDIRWFKENYGNIVKTIRLNTDDEIRIQRGWKFEDGVDNVQSECDLDDYTEWDWIFNNSDTETSNLLSEKIGSLALDS